MTATFRLFPEQASSVAASVDAVFLALLAIGAFFSLLIAGLILYYAIRYRRSRMPVPGRPVPPLSVELMWTIGPLIITLGLFAWGAIVFFHMQSPPEEAAEIYVVGKQWMWKIHHPEGRSEINELHVPVGRAVKLTMISEDVIHSFYIPAFRVKHDVLPGRYTTLWFTATAPGQYHLFCAEYCGTKHSAMIGRIVALEPRRFQEWLSGQIVQEPAASQGQFTFQKLRCASCHSLEQQRGPLLAGRYGHAVGLVGGGTATFDAAYIRESILNPQAKQAAGFPPIMPTYQGQITEEEILAIIDYLKHS